MSNIKFGDYLTLYSLNILAKFQIKILINYFKIYILVVSKILKNQAREFQSESGQWATMSLNHETPASSWQIYSESFGERVFQYSTTLLYSFLGRSPKYALGEGTYEVGYLQRYIYDRHAELPMRSPYSQSTIQALWN